MCLNGWSLPDLLPLKFFPFGLLSEVVHLYETHWLMEARCNKDRKTCQFKVGDLGWLCAYPPIHAGLSHAAKLSARWHGRCKNASFLSQVTARLVDPKDNRYVT
jgi:hypothetical protein